MFFDKIIFICYYIMNITNLINIDPNRVPDVIDVKYLNNKCKVLLKQIEELKYNYQEMIMNRNNKEYTFIDGGKLLHIQPYSSKDVDDVNTCKALCSNQRDCYGFNSYDNMSLFNKKSTTCDFISSGGSITNTGNISKVGPGNSLNIKINEENIRLTKKILDRLISEFHATCNRSLIMVGRMEAFSSREGFVDLMAPTSEATSNNADINTLKNEIINQERSLRQILNDTSFIKKDYNNTYLHVSHNNIMLSIYTIVIIILIIIILKINLVI